MEKLLQQILKEIKPGKEQEAKVKGIANKIISKIKIKDAKPILGGSGAKGKWLKNSHDIDIYVKFNHEKYKDQNISEILEKNLKKNLNAVKLHGSRDYFQVKMEDFTVEIVPILEIKKAEQAMNTTDTSQLHVEWVKKNSTEKLRDEIRLVKAFCKAQDCYGAESYIKGFSGYVLEILTIKYGRFVNFIKNVSKWKSKELIGNKEHIKKLNKSKTQSPLILIDPVQFDRNAAAALSKEKYQKLISSAKQFLKNLDKSFFQKKKFDIKEIKKKAGKNKLILLKAIPLKRKKDVAGAKLVKCLEYLKKQIELNDFKIKDHGFSWEKEAVFYFIMEKDNLEKTKKHYGPPIKEEARLESFKKKWKGKKILKENNRAYIIINREYAEIESFLKDFIKKDSNIKNMVSNIDNLLN